MIPPCHASLSHLAPQRVCPSSLRGKYSTTQTSTTPRRLPGRGLRRTSGQHVHVHVHVHVLLCCLAFDTAVQYVKKYDHICD